MNELFQILDQLGIQYENHEHPAVFTCEEAEEHCSHLPGAKDKNLFLRNKKGNKHYLVSLLANKRLDLKELATKLNESKLSFASPDRLLKYLKLTPGSVTPFGLINDHDNQVQVIIDQDLIDSELLQFHPNTNTATIVLSSADFQKFLEHSGNKYRFMTL